MRVEDNVFVFVVRSGICMIIEKLLLIEFENEMDKWSAVIRIYNLKIYDRYKHFCIGGHSFRGEREERNKRWKEIIEKEIEERLKWHGRM